MKNWRKGSALLLVGMMVMSGLVAFSAPVIADVNVTITGGSGETYTAGFDTANMIDDPATPDDEEPIIINEAGSGVADELIYLGDEISVQCQIWSSHAADPGYDVRVAALSDNSLISIGDDAGDLFVTGAWADPIIVTFDIVVGNVGTVETAYDMHFRLTEDPGGADNSANIPFQIYISSLWHPDDTEDERDNEYTLPDVVDTSGDDPFEAGDVFKQAQLRLFNDAHDVTELNGTLTSLDSQIDLYNDLARIPDGVVENAFAEFNYRVDIAENTPPGDDYEAEFVCDYMRTVGGVEKYVTENMRMSHFAVDFSFADSDPFTPGTDTLWSEFQCYATDVTILNNTRQIDYPAPYDIPTIDQSTYTDEPLRLEVTIVNNGNTPLYNVEFEITPNTWDSFRNPRFFWQDTGGLEYDTISDTYDTFAVGDEITFQIEVFVLNDIPIGEHRLPIVYNGFYFNDGSLGDATGYMDTFANLEVIFSVQVVDDEIACHIAGAVTTGGAGDKVDITAETIEMDITNDEQYNFIDVIVRANFTGTPWYMPVINMGNPWVDANEANAASPAATWDAGADLFVSFDVDTDPNMTPDRYPFQLEITAVIEETLEVVTVIVDYTQGAVIDYGGYGPDIYITAFTAEDIVPGEAFNLDLTLENVGDDTLRDVTVFIPCDDTIPADWDVEQLFKNQFDWSNVFSEWGGEVGGGGVAWEGSEFPSDMFYTVEDLDVDNIREIYEINLYVDGIYSDPGAKIAMIHINDLAPGATIDVTFEMYTDKDMVNGKPYAFDVAIAGIDSEGVDQVYNRQISVMSSLPGSTYNPVEMDWFDAGIKALGLFLFFIIVLAILMFVYNMFKGEPYDEDEDDFDFEDEEPDFEPAPPLMDEEVPEPPAPESEEELVEP